MRECVLWLDLRCLISPGTHGWEVIGSRGYCCWLVVRWGLVEVDHCMCDLEGYISLPGPSLLALLSGHHVMGSSPLPRSCLHPMSSTEPACHKRRPWPQTNLFKWIVGYGISAMSRQSALLRPERETTSSLAEFHAMIVSSCREMQSKGKILKKNKPGWLSRNRATVKERSLLSISLNMSFCLHTSTTHFLQAFPWVRVWQWVRIFYPSRKFLRT